MVKLSIVISYYKTYELTDKLLKVLIPQLNEETEVILIDDGCSERRLDKYDKDIRVVHLIKNGGVSRARNIGIQISKGRYIAFIDSDDMIATDYVEDLLMLINERHEDIIIFNWLDSTTKDLNRHPGNPAVWKAIYKKEIIPLFDETLKVREDYCFQQELEKKNHSIYYYDKVLYMYNSGREGSLWWNETHK